LKTTIAEVEEEIMCGRETLTAAHLFTIAQRHFRKVMGDELIPTDADRLAVLRVLSIEIEEEAFRLGEQNLIAMCQDHIDHLHGEQGKEVPK
jgi:hypothetical protein